MMKLDITWFLISGDEIGYHDFLISGDVIEYNMIPWYLVMSDMMLHWVDRKIMSSKVKKKIEADF